MGVLAVGMFTACEDDDEDPVIPNEEEVITTVRFNLVSAANDTTTWTFTDLDGDGGNDPTIVNAGPIAAGTYTSFIQFLNEQETPAEDITEEVEEEAVNGDDIVGGTRLSSSSHVKGCTAKLEKTFFPAKKGTKLERDET